MKRKTVFQRFVEKIKPPQDPVRDCWVWIGSRMSRGYGQLWVNGKMILAHRFSFDISPRGPLAAGLQIDHLCRNRACVNPLHLEQVTNRENTSRGRGGSLRPGKSSRFVGVRWHQRARKWHTQAYSNGKSVHLGYFDAEEEAAQAYQDLIRTAELTTQQRSKKMKNAYAALLQLIDDSHARAARKGWWDGQRDSGGRVEPILVEPTIPEKLALIHSEVSEMLEAFRYGRMATVVSDGKPEGLWVEAADVLIRLADLAGAMGAGPELVRAVELKAEYNESRGYRHGNKKA